MTLQQYPKVRSAQALPGKRVKVVFANKVVKIYDCTPLIQEAAFSALADEAMFRLVQADSNGYGILWNDAIDLAESELWIHGEVVDTCPRAGE